MSSNRYIVDPNGRQFSADSFDCFGDDLSELLLSYLSLKDKIRLQSVSKEFDRTILRRLLKLKNIEYENPIHKSEVLFGDQHHDMCHLATVLGKCAVRHIDWHFFTVSDSLLETIAEFFPIEQMAID